MSTDPLIVRQATPSSDGAEPGQIHAVRPARLDVDLICFWEPWARTKEERAESVAAARAYLRGDMVEVDEYLERRHRRWRERELYKLE